METVLLVLSTTRESPKTIAYALKKTKEIKGSLIALLVIDTTLPASIVKKLSESGFVGDKPGEEVYANILAEYKQRGEKKLAEIVDQARREGVDAKGVLREGDLAKECLSMIEEEKAFVTIIGRKRVSKLSQFIFGSPIRQIEQNTSCPVEVIEESA